MSAAPPDPAARAPGQWNAYVAAGKSPAARAARLAEVPEHLRPSVESHLRTCAALRTLANKTP